MDAKELYKKHLKRHTPKLVYIGPKQWEHIRYDAAITAIEEALNQS